MTDNIIFDNFLITDDREVHSGWTAQTWQKKTSAEQASISGVSSTFMSRHSTKPVMESMPIVYTQTNMFISVVLLDSAHGLFD